MHMSRFISVRGQRVRGAHFLQIDYTSSVEKGRSAFFNRISTLSPRCENKMRSAR